jgi:hypothetical protein
MRSRSKSWLCATLLSRRMRASVPIVLAAVLLLTAAAIPAQATPPQTPYDVLEERAAKEGAAAVRESYRQDVNVILASLKAPLDQPSLKESFQRTMTVAWLFDYLGSWTFVEARDLRLEKTSQEKAKSEVVEPILDILEAAIGLGAAELRRTERLRSQATPRELASLGLKGSLEPSVAMNRDAVLRRLALLAKLAGAREQLERIFRMTPSKIDSSATAEQFLLYPHDYDFLLGLPRARGKESEQRLLTPEERDAVRQLVENFWGAIIRRDADSIARLYLEPLAASAVVKKMADVELVSVDLRRANFQFELAGPELVQVRVDNVLAIVIKNGQKVSTVGGKTFVAVLRNGRALLVDVRGAR